jgi:long-chain fatty acid transport protein
MKKVLLSFICLFMAFSELFAGGLVTNTNQSASWARMMVRDASTSIDAAYFNPAGLTKLNDGLHLYLSNQSIFQTRTITNSLFTGKEWTAEVAAPLFPNFYMAYKTGKMAFSLGFAPIGGGGSANYADGVPMVEVPLLALKTLPGVTGGPTVKANLEGTSIYLGLQGGISYAINDMISVYAGVRYVMASNAYVGAVKDIMVQTAGGNVKAETYMLTLAAQATAGATQLTNTATAMAPLVTNYGSFTFDQVIAATAGDPATQAQVTALRNGLTNLGQANAGSLTITQGQTAYNTYAAGYTAQATQLTAQSTLMKDQEADVKQKGSGITPIVGVNLSLLEDKLNIGIKYEFHTDMKVKNETVANKGFVVGLTQQGQKIEMYPDGKETSADIPAMLSVGVNYKFSDKFSTQIGYHTYFDKAAGWSVVENSNPEISKVDKNFWEIGIGLEYALNEKLLLSTGFLAAMSGVNKYYQNDLSYSLNSYTVGLGGLYRINDMFSLELGAFNTFYTEGTYAGTGTTAYNQTYNKSNLGFALGLNFNFGAK